MRKLEVPINEGKEALAYLRKVDLSIAKYDEIKKKTDILVRCGFTAGELQPLTISIYRGVGLQEDEIAKTIERISYRRKNSESLRLNRASSSKHKIFYGAIPTEEFQDGSVAAITEIDQIRNDSFPEGKYEYIAMGLWFVSKPLLVVNAGMHSEIAPNTKWGRNIAIEDREISSQLKHADFLKEVMKFLGKEFGKEVKEGEEFQYMISAAYGDSLFDLGLPAIIFPSFQSNGKSFNIAIHSNAVDNKMIDIEAAAVLKGSKIGNTIFWGWHLQCPRVFGDTLTWEEPPSHTQVWQNDLERFRSLIANQGYFVKNPTIIK